MSTSINLPSCGWHPDWTSVLSYDMRLWGMAALVSRGGSAFQY